MFSVGLNRAVTLLAEKKSRARPQRESKALRELGAHPEDGKPVRVMDGRYGPYVKHERLNATLPKDLPPDKVTLEEALALLAARAARGAKGKARKAKPANDDAGVKKSARGGAKKKSAKGRKAKVSDDTSESEIAHEEETGAKRTARAGR
jgi:DNA topoisomerase-1